MHPYYSDNWLCLDFETTNLDRGSSTNRNNSLLLSVWEYRGELKSCRAGEHDQNELLAAVESCDFVVAHQSKFELGWLARCGLDLSTITVYDTLLAEYVQAGNIRTELSLDATAKRFGVGSKSSWVSCAIRSGVPVEDIPENELLSYCENDVLLTAEIFRRQVARSKLGSDYPMGAIYERCLLTPVLADIEKNGMRLDAARVEAEYTKKIQESEEVGAELAALTGGINPRSVKQVAAYLYDTLGFTAPKDKRSGEEIRGTSKAAIDALVPKTAAQKKFIELKKKQSAVDSLLSKTLAPLHKCCAETADATLYGVFNQAVTQTHRLSSSGRTYGVQFQNFPRAHKRLFMARNAGWKIVEADSSQLEFRVAGHLGSDAKVKEDVLSKIDVHAFTASVLTEAGQETSRQDAKKSTFKPLYGGSSGTKAEQAYYSAFKKKYAGIAKTQQSWIDTVLRTKRLVTCTGLTFHWPDTKMSRTGYVNNTTSICNYPVQSFATGSIIPLGVVALWKEMRKRNMRAFLVNTVHDSIVAEVPEEEVEEFSRLAKWALTEGVYAALREIHGIELKVPLDADVKSAYHWGSD